MLYWKSACMAVVAGPTAFAESENDKFNQHMLDADRIGTHSL